ncbi:MAG: hypothetical protein KAS32_27900 [Candidatus Peribacteraceae bacterium]|nr:hypothetical protein [Candidatus Peribacteraceae bacterium]
MDGIVSKSYIDTKMGQLVQGVKDKNKPFNKGEGWIQKFLAGEVGQTTDANSPIKDNRRGT